MLLTCLSAHVTSLVLLYALNKLLGGDYHVRLVLSALETTRARVLIMPTHIKLPTHHTYIIMTGDHMVPPNHIFIVICTGV